MDTPHLEELCILECEEGRYKGIAFDGLFLYLTVQKSICVFDLSMNKLDQVQTFQRFTSICYDPCLDCFWALTDKCHHVYRLNRMLCEVDRIELPRKCIRPTGVSCDSNGELLISSGESLYCVSKSGCMNAYDIKHFPGIRLLNACALDNGYMCSGVMDYGSVVKQFTPCDVSCSILLPEGYIPIGMSSGRNCHEVFLLVVNNNRYFHICRCHSECGRCEEPCIKPPHKKPCCDPCMKPPHIKPCCDPYEEPCIKPPPKKPCYEPCKKTPCGKQCCCDSCCDPCTCCPKPPPRPKPCKGQELCDIIESIALTETALSHILNAEGEKLQRVLELTEDPQLLLETNKSISNTISNVTHLEYVLFEKLRIAQEMSNREEQKHKSCKSVC